MNIDTLAPVTPLSENFYLEKQQTLGKSQIPWTSYPSKFNIAI